MYHREALRHVVSVAEAGTKPYPNQIGYAGISLQILDNVVTKGVLLGPVVVPNSVLPFYPITEAMPKEHPFIADFLPEQQALEKAREQAQIVARAHSLLAYYDLKLQYSETYKRAIILTGSTEPESAEYQSAYRKFLSNTSNDNDKDDLEEAIKLAREDIKGLVCGLDRACLEEAEVQLIKGGGVKPLLLRLGAKGLSYRFITSLELLGETETWNFNRYKKAI